MSETDFRPREGGTSAVEYGLLVGVVSLSTVIAANLAGPLAGVFTSLSAYFTTLIAGG